MSKLYLKLTRKLLDIATRVYDTVENLRIKALYKELIALNERRHARTEAGRKDDALEVAIFHELDDLEGDEDETDE